MSKYAVTFSKEGYIKYTSHLDMLRLFKRAVKKSGIKLAYSQGYNPHPKMGFAQPLSLGYESVCELLEIETIEEMPCEQIIKKLQSAMPDGMTIKDCVAVSNDMKSIASLVEWAYYVVSFPVSNDKLKNEQIVANYLAQDEIYAEKRQKKTKKLVTVNIKSKIRDMKVLDGQTLALGLTLDCGSNSNLSPEQVIASFLKFTKIPCERYEVEVLREKMGFGKKLQL